MSNEQAKQVLQQGIAAARAGQQDQARKLLQEAVKRDPQSESAWLWLSSVAKDDKERIFCLKQLLNINPNNDNAIKGLRQLGVNVGESGPTGASTNTASTQAPASEPIVTAGAPQIDEQRLNTSLSQLDPILLSYQPIPKADLPFQWTKKRGGRVGDASALILRTGVIAGVAAVVILLLGGGVFAASKLGVPIAILTTPTATATSTPTLTPTGGFTNTPSPTPKSTQEPSATPENKIKKGDIYNMQPTPIYPEVASGRIVREALDLAAAGNFTDAATKLDNELKARVNAKDDNYYAIVYYLANMYVDSGNPDRAVALLNGNKPAKPSPYFDAALGYAQYALNDTENALALSTSALKADPQLALAAITIARINTAKGAYPEARRSLNIAIESQPSNAALLVERAKTFLAEGNFKQAEADSLLALYIDPLNRGAYVARIQTILADASTMNSTTRVQRYGTAVLAVKDFLLYYPNDTLAWKLLGDARLGEQNTNDALDAYAQAVVIDRKSPDAQQVFIARGTMYLVQRNYAAAYDDFDRALEISKTPAALRGRFDAGLQLKNYNAAAADLAELIRQNPDDQNLKLTQADLWIHTENFADIVALLNDKFINDLPKELKPTAQLYRGIARFKTSTQPEKGDGLDDLNAAIAAKESGIGHYYRGQVFEAMGQPIDAILDLQWVSYWNQVFNYDFADDVQQRLDRLSVVLPTATPTITPSPTKPVTPTKTPRVTKTPTDTDTPEPTVTPTPTKGKATATASRTPTPTDAGDATSAATVRSAS